MTIALLGDIAMDVTISVAAYPPVGGDALVRQVTSRPGGSVSNTALALARLGYPARMLGQAGMDAPGDEALAALAGEGVDIRHVRRDPAQMTGQIYIIVSADGERTMFSARGANVQLSPAFIVGSMLAGAECLHTSSYSFLAAPQKEAAWKLSALAGEMGLPVSMDIAAGHADLIRADLDLLLPKLDMILLGAADAQRLTGQQDLRAAADALLRRGPVVTAIKLGGQGCLVAGGDTLYELPALPAHAVDTTGAGDAFAAGMLYGRRSGLNLPDTAWLANALGALATMTVGAGPLLPGRQELLSYISSLQGNSLDDGWRERLLAHFLAVH